MPIQATCPKCLASYNLADRQLGKKVRCKGCEEIFEVQESAAASQRAKVNPGRETGSGIAAERSSPARREPIADEPDDDDDDRPLKLKGDDSPERAAGDRESDRGSRRKKRSIWDDAPDRERKKNRGGFRILPPDDYGPKGIWLIASAAVALALFFLSLATWVFTIPLLIVGLVYGILGLVRFCRCLSEDGFPWILFILFKPIGLIFAIRDPERSGKHLLFYVLWIGCIGLAAVFVDFPSKSKDSGSAVTRKHRPGGEPEDFEPGDDKPIQVRGEIPSVARRPGLIAYWPFDEGEGDSAADASGNGHPGVIHEATWVDGVRGKALWFPKDDIWFDYGASPAFNFPANSGFTFVGWIQTKDKNGMVFAQRRKNDGGPDIEVSVNNGRMRGLARQDGGGELSAVTVVGGTVNDGVWHHFALTRQPSGVIELFIDGRSQGTAVGASSKGAITTDMRSAAREQYWLMINRGPGWPHFHGCLDEFAIFNRALTDPEIRELAGWPAGNADEVQPAAVRNALLGTWKVRVGKTFDVDWTFNADGTIDGTAGTIRRGQWTIDEAKRRVFIPWGSDKVWETLWLPLDPKGTIGESHNGPDWPVHAIKIK